MSKQRHVKYFGEKYHGKLLVLWLILGLGAAVYINHSLTDSYIERRRETLANMCKERAWMLQDQFNSSMNHVRSLTALVTTFHLAKQPSALDQARQFFWTSFERPLMSGVAYAHKVEHWQRRAFEEEMGWSIKEMRSNAPRAQNLDEYAPTVLSQNTLAHLASVDMMSGEEDRENILRSRASGKGALTSPFRLLESDHLGVVLTFTVYKTDLPDDATPAQRIQATAGYVGGAFDFESLVENLLRQLSESQTIIVNVNDVTNKSNPLVMYGPNIPDGNEIEVCQLEFGDPFRKHEMRCRFNKEASVVWTAITTTFGIVVIVLLVAQIFYAAGNRIAKVEEDYRKMEDLKVRAESADVAKSQFLATVSHEIRTPMNGVLGMLQMLMDTELDSTQRDYAHTALESGKQLIKLINEVLDQAKIESGRMELETVPFKLRTILDDILTLFSAENKDKGIELAAYVSERVPDVVLGDPVRLHQIVTNLVGNSIKFTDRGHIFVSVHLEEDVKAAMSAQCEACSKQVTETQDHSDKLNTVDAAGSCSTLSGLEAADRRNNWETFKLILKQEKSRLTTHKQPVDTVKLVFSVEDTGVGIPVHAQERVFSPFMQADSSTSRNYGGTGIGLSISKCLVELMKGEIGFVSSLGVGTTFWFTVNFKVGDLEALEAAHSAECSKQQRAAHSSTPLTTQLSGLKALVVDGRPVRSEVTRYHLRRLGIQVDVASDVSSALAHQRSKNLDMILIDKDAWGSSTGLSYPSKIKEAGPTLAPKLVLLAFDDDEHKAKAAGFSDNVIKKPLRASYIANHLEKALGLDLKRRTRESSTPTSSSSDTSASINSGSGSSNNLHSLLTGKWILVVDDNKVNRRVAAGALQKYGARVECVESGRLAIEKLEPPHKFDACFMDIQMPEMDGFEATRRIRCFEKRGGSHVPILAMTADVIQATYDECRRCGMDDYVSKPFEEKQLYRAVAKFF
ncbi:cytokinin receptor [Selaginella moellendorffii]|uniref:histidine kinase n=1 Tax=Selaginella moellendorffii TaxID=88036 RepID=D8R9F4_SELML|nr:cytokinin receptor [Selaginella moellendorffii]